MDLHNKQSQNDLSFYYEGSNDKAVLLIHGLTGSPAEMRYLGKSLHKAGFTVYAPLLAGHGGTTDDLLKTKWQDWYNSVEQAYNFLSTKFNNIYTAGICVGGALGIKLAIKYPKLSGSVIYSVTLRYDGWSMPKYYALSPIMPILAYIPFVRSISFPETAYFGLKDQRLRKKVQSGAMFVEGALDSFPLLALVQMYNLNKNLKSILPQIKIPTLLIHAREDDMSNPRNAEYVMKHIGGPCKLVFMENSYHMLHVDQERGLVAKITAEFFNNGIDVNNKN